LPRTCKRKEGKHYLGGFHSTLVEGKNGDVMIEIPLPRATSLISPRLTVLVNTTDEMGELNSSPYSWVFPLSFNPPLIGIGIGGKTKHSHLNAKRTGEFVVCVVSADFSQQAVNCEAQHGAGDKLWKKQGLHTQKSKKVAVPRIKEARAILECKTTKFLEYGGDHIILVGEVLHAEAEERLEERNPLLHDSGEKFRVIGEQIPLKRRK
jgi:flavin reductase (DIM6/NTAB) family NADH-FMN oxidoreductase RutF